MSKRNRHKQKMARLMGGQNTPSLPPALNLDYMNAATVTIDEFKFVQVVIAGCGGIGAYMAMHVGRLMRVLYNDQRGVNLTLVDPDDVEEKNLGRQLFCEAELGQPKALALARRYGGAWGLNTMAHVGEFEEQLLHTDSDLIVLVGCVDNAAARNALNDTLSHNPEAVAPHALPHIWWLDCGNLKDTGRALLGSAYGNEQCRGAFVWPNPQAQRPSKCIALPSPALQYPGLLIPEKEESGGAEMSCAEMQAANLQSLNINAGIAVQAADMLTRLLVTRDLKRYQCAVNLASGSVKSYYCTPEEIAREIDRPVDFVVREKARELAA